MSDDRPPWERGPNNPAVVALNRRPNLTKKDAFLFVANVLAQVFLEKTDHKFTTNKNQWSELAKEREMRAQARGFTENGQYLVLTQRRHGDFWAVDLQVFASAQEFDADSERTVFTLEASAARAFTVPTDHPEFDSWPLIQTTGRTDLIPYCGCPDDYCSCCVDLLYWTRMLIEKSQYMNLEALRSLGWQDWIIYD